MLLKTGTPSAGQPIPVKGWQFGDENGRVPTNVSPLGATVLNTVPPGMQFPPGPALYGRTKPVHVDAGTLKGCVGGVKVGITTGVPSLYFAGIMYWPSAPTGPQPEPLRVPVGSLLKICPISAQV